MGTKIIDLASMAAKAANPDGFGYAPGFLELYSRPSRTLTDFFGLLPIADAGVREAKADFVPGIASLEEETEDTLLLDFHGLGRVRLWFNSAIDIRGMRLERSFAEFPGERYTDYAPGVFGFISLLEERGLAGKYLLPNPHYERELEVFRRMNSGGKALRPAETGEAARFAASDNAVLIYPDRVHGHAENIAALCELVERLDFDWLAFEMLGDAQQPALDALAESPDSEAGRRALDELAAYFAGAWRLDEDFANPEDNYFVRAVAACAAKGVRVYGLELSDPEYLLFRNGETEFGGAVRSDVWSSRVPLGGRGIVVGGSAHFSDARPVNFQDLHLARNPSAEFYIWDREGEA